MYQVYLCVLYGVKIFDEQKIAEPKAGRKPAAAKAEVKVEADPWKLGDKSTQKDWQETRCPPLSMFSWVDPLALGPNPCIDLTSLQFRENRHRRIHLSGTSPLGSRASYRGSISLDTVRNSTNEGLLGYQNVIVYPVAFQCRFTDYCVLQNCQPFAYPSGSR